MGTEQKYTIKYMFDVSYIFLKSHLETVGRSSSSIPEPELMQFLLYCSG